MAVTLSMSLTLAPPAYSYNGSSAAAYARAHYSSSTYNSNYGKFSSDCTNFASQAVYAGGQAMTRPSKINSGITTTSSYWYSYKATMQLSFFLWTWKVPVFAQSSSWVRVAGGQGFYDYFKSRKTTYVSKDLNYIRSKAQLGDVIQVMTQGESAKSHSTIVGAKTATEITLYYHTNDTYRTLLSFDKAYGKGLGTNAYTLYHMQ